MEANAVTPFVNTYALPTGRRVFLAKEVHARAAKRGVKKVAKLALRLVKHDHETLNLELKRRAGGRGRYSGEAQALDNLLDRCVGGMDGYLDVQMRLYTETDPRGLAAAKIRQAAFADDVAAITMLPYVQQCEAVDTLLGRLEEPDLAESMAALPDLALVIERVSEVNEEYRTALVEYDRGVPSAEEVRAAQVEGQELLAGLLVVILAHYVTEAPDDSEGRADLLEPLLRQNEDVRAARRRRRQPTDVDPDTGADLSADALPSEDDGDIDTPALDDIQS